MTKSIHRGKGAIWRADWVAGVAIVAATLLLQLSTDLMETLERRCYDFASTRTTRQASDRIAVIAIDDQSIANIGRWPWPRDVHAKMIDLLAGAKTVVHTVLFIEPQVDPGLLYIRKIKDALASTGETGAPNGQIGALITEAETALDTDAVLAASLQRAGNVLLPAVFTLGESKGLAYQALPDYALKSAVDDLKGFSVSALRAQQPIALLGNAAAGVGHLTQLKDVDGAVRMTPLWVNYYGRAVPSMALLAAAHSLNLQAHDIGLRPGEAVQMGGLRIRTDASARMLTQFYRSHDGRPAFAVDSFDDVLTGKIAAAQYAGKIVIIGATAAGIGTPFAVPGYAALSPPETLAHIISSLLKGHFLVQPVWGIGVSWGAFSLVAAYVIAALPRLSVGRGAATTLLLFVALLGLEFGLLSLAAIWIKLVAAATLLLLGHVALTAKRLLLSEAAEVKTREESAETNRLMGLALQGQGQLDMAFERLRLVPMGAALMGSLYSLAMDFERKHQFNKAEAVYGHMAAFDAAYKDVQARRNRASNLCGTAMLDGCGARPDGTLLPDGDATAQPMLGRYQLEKELGKGAMGVVYQGLDPKIGRVVAIKTLALSQEFAGAELTDARERFFREAETAGRLQHQNIVTIFDVGEAHGLAYIAMEFLKGRDLAQHCKLDRLLPAATVVDIVARVADALAYAHLQNVVHRDIKPANIMFDAASDTVKVTDFGIARITDSSKTRTGLVLGTPSFMSPEQLAGNKVDGRSDLYSLAGVLPFRGESMSELMFKIANQEAADIRVVRPDISQALADVVARALSKRPEMRYQSGAQFAADLRELAAQWSVQPSGRSAGAIDIEI